MPNPTFPTLSRGQDSSLYSVELEDVSAATPMEGGYVVSRAKHTRAPRKTFTSGFTDITEADKALLDAFWTTVRGGSVIFDWIDPASANGGAPVTYSVRFLGGPLKFDYRGHGPTKRYDVRFTVQQA